MPGWRPSWRRRPGLKTGRERFLFANLVLVALIGINGISMVRDLFSLYVFIEVTSVATFILVAIRHGTDAFEGAWKYLVLSAVASVFMLSSIALYLLVEGGVSFAAVDACPGFSRAHTVDCGGPFPVRPVHQGRPGALPRMAGGRLQRGPRPRLGLHGGDRDKGLGSLRAHAAGPVSLR